MGAACCTTVHFSDAKTLPLTADALENIDIIARSNSHSTIEAGFSDRLKMYLPTLVQSNKSNSTTSNKSRGPDVVSPGREIKEMTIKVYKTLVNPNNFPVNDLISKRIWEGQKLCAKEPKICQAFASYVMGMTWLKKVSVQLLDQAIKRRRTQDTQEVTFNEYAIYPRSRSASHDSREIEEVAATMRRMTQLKIKDAMDMDSLRRKSLIDTVFTSDQIKAVLLAALWPIFVESPEYAAATNSNGEEEGSGLYEREEDDATQSDKFNVKEHDSEKTKRVKSIYYQTANSMTEEEIVQMLRSGQWVHRVISTLEETKLSVSISSADPKQQGFPMVFVNKAFEKTTLYPRAEVLGKKCSLLQCARTEPEQMVKISEALGRGEGVKVAITNAKKNGVEFCNFLALRPVYDAQGVYHMVLGVQYDITEDEASLKEIKMIEDFLAIMCNVLKG